MLEKEIEKDCLQWLESVLQDHEIHLCDAVREKAKRAGYSKIELKQARNRLDVKTFHQFDESGSTENWFWYQEV